MAEIRKFTGGFAATNGWALRAREGWIVIDAPEGMAGWLQAEALPAAALFLTHCHFDHVVDAARIVREHGCEVWAWAPSTREDRLEWLVEMATGLSLRVEDYPVHHVLKGGEDRHLVVAGMEFLVRHVPGHSPDSVVFICDSERLVLAGDTVMDGSIGRSDFPGGDGALLVRGIIEKILTLPGDYRLLPGHGGISTVERERADNPFL